MSSNECITVVLRCRPMNSKEKSENRKNIIKITPEDRQVEILSPDGSEEGSKTFTFDASYDENTQQKVFYDESCFSIIESCLEGFNATIFAYGQTGCGKSFTMQGPSVYDEEVRGVIPNSFFHIFQYVKTTKNIEFLIRCSYLELYNEEIRDLLANPKQNNNAALKCELKEDSQRGIYIKNLTSVVVESPEDLIKMFDKGLVNRTVASTLMNSESSRSHSIFTIVIEMNTKDADTNKDLLRVGKLNLVDLAGSERVKKTGAKDSTLKEGIKINLSLSVLGNVISALADNSKHIPYRDSKLTRLLQDSLGGNTKTMMIAAISPADYNYDETLSTLRYANRAKNIKNKPKINEDPKDAMIREFKAEIEKLRKLLMEQAGAAKISEQLSLPQFLPNEGEKKKEENSVPMASAIVPVASTAADAVPDSTTSAPSDFQISNPQEEIINTEPSPQLEAQPFQSPREQEYEDDYESPSPEKISHANKNPDSKKNSETNEELDKKLRDEVANRLHQLEHLLVKNDNDLTNAEINPTVTGQTTSNVSASELAHSNSKLLSPVKTEEEKAKEEIELNIYKEKKMKAKKKLKEKEIRETQNLNNELDDTITDDPSLEWNEKINKLKKKFEKKISTLKENMEVMKEESEYQRKELLDAMLEQEKDTKLYDLICRKFLSEKELKKIVEKSKYDDELDEWILPNNIKKSSFDSSAPEDTSIRASFNSGGSNFPEISNKSIFPTINNSTFEPTVKVNSNMASIMTNFNEINSLNSSESSSSSFIPPITLGGHSSSNNNNNNNPSVGSRSSSRYNNSSSFNSSVYSARLANIPLLTIPGNFVTLASEYNNYSNEDYDINQELNKRGLLSGRKNYQPAQPNLNNYANNVPNYLTSSSLNSNNGSLLSARSIGDSSDLPGIASSNTKGNADKKKPKIKLPKNNITGPTPIPVSSNPISNNNNNSNNFGNFSDESGNGESAGSLDEWGFAVNKNIPEPSETYSDDEDFVSEKETKKKKKKKNKDNGGSSLPSVNSSNNSLLPPLSNRGNSLPPI